MPFETATPDPPLRMRFYERNLGTELPAVRRCRRCGHRPRLLHCIWFRPRPAWVVHCCASFPPASDSRRAAIQFWKDAARD